MRRIVDFAWATGTLVAYVIASLVFGGRDSSKRDRFWKDLP